jgi:hypothetical protein
MKSVQRKETDMRTTFTILATLLFSMTLMAADSFDGTWKLNLPKIQAPM